MSIENLMDRWKLQTTRMSRPKIASFCGMPDPVALKKALCENELVVILVYRPFGISVRKAKWRVDRSSYMDQYWRRVWVKIGDIDKNRIQVFCLPIMNVLQAPALLDSLVNGRFKNHSVGITDSQEASQLVEFEVEFWNPPAGFNRGLSPVNNESSACISAEDSEQASAFGKKFVFDADQYELNKTDDVTQLDTLKAMTDNYFRD